MLAADEIAHGILVVPEMLGVLKVKFHREVKTWPVCALVVVTSTPGANPTGVNAMWVLGCLGAYSHSNLLVALSVLQKQQNQAGQGMGISISPRLVIDLKNEFQADDDEMKRERGKHSQFKKFSSANADPKNQGGIWGPSYLGRVEMEPFMAAFLT